MTQDADQKFQILVQRAFEVLGVPIFSNQVSTFLRKKNGYYVMKLPDIYSLKMGFIKTLQKEDLKKNSRVFIVTNGKTDILLARDADLRQECVTVEGPDGQEQTQPLALIYGRSCYYIFRTGTINNLIDDWIRSPALYPAELRAHRCLNVDQRAIMTPT